MALVTVSRQEACRGEEVAAAVARLLNFRLVDRNVMREMLYSFDLLAAIGRIDAGVEAGSEGEAMRGAAEGIIWHLAAREDLVVLGFGGQFLLSGCPGALHVRLEAALEHRLAVAEARGTHRSVTALRRRDRERRRLVRALFGADLARHEHYDLVARVDTLGVGGAAGVVAEAARAAGVASGGRFDEIRGCARGRSIREIPVEILPPPAPAVPAPFANESEAEFAKVLDFYRIPWRYEPESFPIDWWPDGRVRSSFTPDFYLPELDTYLELTTMRQSLVTKKNRKVRRFRELYPGKKLLIFYGRDFRRLAQKFGLE